MSAVTRRTDSMAPFVAFMVFLLAVAGTASIWTLAGLFSGTSTGFVNPVEQLRDGAPWTPAHTAAAVLVGIVVVGLVVAIAVVTLRHGRDRSPADKAARHMGTGREIAPLTPSSLRKRHQRMGLPPEFVGVTVGHTVAGTVPLRASYEDTLTVIAGPRRNKSASIVIPNAVAAPGSLLITSVRPDIAADTLTVRSSVGKVSMFDPQRLASAYRGHDCWWNPLAGIRTIDDAAQLAEVFAAATYGHEGNKDPYFPTTGKSLMTHYLFAAAMGGKYLPTVLEWLNHDDNPAPANVLQESHPHLADGIEALQALTERTRSGVYGYARTAMNFLVSDSIRTWVQPVPGEEAFDPETFATAPADTLYLFSEEGPGSAGPLIAALTKAVLNAAENTAKQEPSGRLKRPLMVILDEAGNICRIPDLPKKYTTYGGRGIIPVTILQTEEQGVDVWGESGFGQLWASSTVQVFGGGNASNKFLRDLSERIGDYEYQERSTSTHDGKRTVSRSRRSERIMEVADLGALSLGRMVVLASGCRPALVRSIPWWNDKAIAKLNTAAVAAGPKKELDNAAF
ncbi:type IV secretory system conjugative DNA transfer family protein [Frigoribacterium sp. CFBP 13707]|uniref:type IV secretory system conjugative DNA transfer family protein n=1 Tax=Frigoribacterium sp. CFBP 13707 TaxID=2775313 RepID=UPI0017832018|nr:type IV secretory system conjugative DNA transfer family protein [Frigoribacterium sp. CFBP 13707]MBD8729358.1 TraM recognition domain-containing protein [Frigoribacterium sp. CFBP 13707]